MRNSNCEIFVLLNVNCLLSTVCQKGFQCQKESSQEEKETAGSGMWIWCYSKMHRIYLKCENWWNTQLHKLLQQLPEMASVPGTGESLAKLLQFSPSEAHRAITMLICWQNTRNSCLLVISLPPSEILHEQAWSTIFVWNISTRTHSDGTDFSIICITVWA